MRFSQLVFSRYYAFALLFPFAMLGVSGQIGFFSTPASTRIHLDSKEEYRRTGGISGQPFWTEFGVFCVIFCLFLFFCRSEIMCGLQEYLRMGGSSSLPFWTDFSYSV